MIGKWNYFATKKKYFFESQFPYLKMKTNNNRYFHRCLILANVTNIDCFSSSVARSMFVYFSL